jgi:hypothetical protein
MIMHNVGLMSAILSCVTSVLGDVTSASHLNANIGT